MSSRLDQLRELRLKLLAMHDIASRYSDLADFPLDPDSDQELATFIRECGINHHHMLVAIEPMIATVDQLIDDQLSATAPLKRRMRPWMLVLLVALLLFWGPFVLIVALAAR